MNNIENGITKKKIRDKIVKKVRQRNRWKNMDLSLGYKVKSNE